MDLCYSFLIRINIENGDTWSLELFSSTEFSVIIIPIAYQNVFQELTRSGYWPIKSVMVRTFLIEDFQARKIQDCKFRKTGSFIKYLIRRFIRISSSSFRIRYKDPRHPRCVVYRWRFNYHEEIRLFKSINLVNTDNSLSNTNLPHKCHLYPMTDALSI